MSDLCVSLVFEPRPKDWPDQSTGYDIFMRDLEKRLGREIPRLSGVIPDLLPLDGYLLVRPVDPRRPFSNCSPEVASHLSKRSVVFGLASDEIADALEYGRPAAAFDDIAFGRWSTRPYRGIGARGLYGYADFASRVGARCDPMPPVPPTHVVEPYCCLESDTHESFTYLLADYLRLLASEGGQAT